MFYIAMCNQTSQEKQSSPAVMSTQGENQELTEAPAHKVLDVEQSMEEDRVLSATKKQEEVPTVSQKEEKEAQLPSRNGEKEKSLGSKKEEEIPLSSKKEDNQVLLASKKEENGVVRKKEEEAEAIKMDEDQDRQNSMEEKPLAKEGKKEAEEEHAPSPRSTRARRREVSQTPEVVE